jgi:hypothetical protein
MDALFEQHVTHNLAITAFAVGQAAIQMRQETDNARGLSLFEAMLVPPLVFHRRTAEAFSGRQRTDGLFYRVIADDRELVIGTQSRLIDLTPRTLQAIHLGCSADLFKLVHANGIELVASSKSLPSAAENLSNTEAVTTILAAAKRLGYCFATTEFSVICTALRVRF